MLPTLSDCKSYAQIDADYILDDGLISDLLKAAISWCEQYTGLLFTEQEITETKLLRHFRLKAPLISITSVKVLDENVDYNFTGEWVRSVNGVKTVIYRAGYPENTLPEPIKTAIKLMVQTLYRNREDYIVSDVTKAINQVPIGIKELLSPYSISGGLFL
ncbi:phage gp6-like head-tail connector protein [Pedobacter sp. HDW13]|uniref:head-tail connector protein n=1 Tax=Pedobacter sp. HDW13 TaxID=2714940 RepID=UPI00140B5DA4|nr:head-tail connector protein [Pedobacter sp. HDW13]QIL41021.1 phage gp6-like head-tail connector protein [Pedobacter sp. HDW13]